MTALSVRVGSAVAAMIAKLVGMGVPFLDFDEFPTYGTQRIHVVAANLDYADLSSCLTALDRRVSARSPRKPSEEPSTRRSERQNNFNGSGEGGPIRRECGGPGN